MGGIIVEGRKVTKLAAAGLQKYIPPFVDDFVQSLQAIGGEARTHDMHRADVLLAPILE